MLTDKLALQIATFAGASGIPKSAMLADVEVETAGNPNDFLFERHIFHRELSARQPAKLAQAVKLGLAYPAWRPKTASDKGQYFDERSTEERMALLAKAKAIDEDCALRACSWGLPQIMGNECHEVGFPNAKAMVAFMASGGVPAHLELMVRFLKARNLISAMERKDWAYYALRYNGKGYKRNQYDTRLAAADKKWERRLPALEAAPAAEFPEEHLSGEQIKQVQIKLRQLGYAEVGNPDKRWGDKTGAAIWAFQKHEGLPTTGHYDDATRAALATAEPRPVPEVRAETSLDDLRAAGSTTVANADKGSIAGVLKMGAGGATVLASIAGKGSEAIDGAQTAVDKADQAKTLISSIHDLLGGFADPRVLAVGVVLLVGGWLVMRYCAHVKAARLADHQDGTHAGTMAD